MACGVEEVYGAELVCDADSVAQPRGTSGRARRGARSALTRMTLPAARGARGHDRGAWMCRGSRRHVTRGQPSHALGAVDHPPCRGRGPEGPGNGQNSRMTYLTEQCE